MGGGREGPEGCPSWRAAGRGEVLGAARGGGVTDSPLRAVQPPARCVHVARVSVRLCVCPARALRAVPGISPLEMGPHQGLAREVERGRCTPAMSPRTGLGDGGSMGVCGWRGAFPPSARGSGSPVGLDLHFDLDLKGLRIIRGLATWWKGRVLFREFMRLFSGL